jgi:hypothetical protein
VPCTIQATKQQSHEETNATWLIGVLTIVFRNGVRDF